MSHKTPRPAVAAAERDPFRPWLLAGIVALYVARPLLPSEGTIASGDSLLFVLLPLILLAVWAMRAVMQRGGMTRCGALDLAVLFLVVWHGVSAVVAMRTGAPRPAINAAWQWLSLATMFFLVRQLVVNGSELRAIAAVMVALAVTMSAYGFHQFFYSIPRDQARFRENPEAALQEAHVAAPPGSRQRLLFEQRVNSSEPMATFALANSLAGFLVPWSLVALGICVIVGVMRSRDLRLWLPAALCALVIVACLVLTKSRAGYVATAVGICALALWTIVQGARISRRTVAIVVLLVVALLAGAIGVGALDREVLSEAGKSLGYRWQYWKATVAMIKDHPLLGCGPGQFQGFYTQHMLADASETVADPHNFLLEVAATAGLPAAAALLIVMGLVAWQVARPAAIALPEDTGSSSYHIYVGAAAGFLFAFAIGPLATVPLGPAACAGGLLTSALAIAGLEPWVRRGRVTAGLLGIAAAALLVNLLAGGGINFAGVAGSLWLLAALCLVSREGWRGLPLSVAAAVFAGAVCLSATFYFTVYGPVLACNAELDLAAIEPQRAEAHLAAAAVADPLSAEPLKRLAMLEWNFWQQHPSAATFDRFTATIDEAARLDPHLTPLMELKGDICLEVHRGTREARPLELAVAAYRRATDLYPNGGLLHAKLAVALSEAGEAHAATAEAARALALNELTPHKDQKLPAEILERMQSLAAGTN